MKITYLEQERVFHLKTPEMSYAFGVAPDGRYTPSRWKCIIRAGRSCR